MRMNTKLIMTASAVLLAIIGLTLTFLATEIADYFLMRSTTLFQLLIQVLGALYVAFAMLNWMAKGSIIGGIYNRPIVIANFAHFLIGALAMIKTLMKHPDLLPVIWIIAVVYCIFSLVFAILLFHSPITKPTLRATNQ
jgi:hypothetical protein